MRNRNGGILCPDLNGKLWRTAYPCGQDPLLEMWRLHGATLMHRRWVDGAWWKRLGGFVQHDAGYKPAKRGVKQ